MADKPRARPALSNVKPQPVPDAADVDVRDRAELDRAERLFRRLQRTSIAQDIRERKRYADKVFRLVRGWLVAVLVLIVASGFSWTRFVLPENVILALIGGTTISVLGLFVIVANYLFPKPPKS